MTSVPLFIDLSGKKIVVVGGGNVAQRRIRSLIDTGCSIVVVSPDVTPKISNYHNKGLIIWEKKEFSSSDLEHAFMVIVATNSSTVNHHVISSTPSHVLVNAVEDVSWGDVQFPIHLQRGKLSVAITTNGASPTLAKQIKQNLEVEFDDSYEDYLDFLFEARQLIKQTTMNSEQKRSLLKSIVVTEHYKDREQQKELLDRIRNQTQN